MTNKETVGPEVRAWAWLNVPSAARTRHASHRCASCWMPLYGAHVNTKNAMTDCLGHPGGSLQLHSPSHLLCMCLPLQGLRFLLGEVLPVQMVGQQEALDRPAPSALHIPLPTSPGAIRTLANQPALAYRDPPKSTRA